MSASRSDVEQSIEEQKKSPTEKSSEEILALIAKAGLYFPNNTLTESEKKKSVRYMDEKKFAGNIINLQKEIQDPEIEIHVFLEHMMNIGRCCLPNNKRNQQILNRTLDLLSYMDKRFEHPNLFTKKDLFEIVINPPSMSKEKFNAFITKLNGIKNPHSKDGPIARYYLRITEIFLQFPWDKDSPMRNKLSLIRYHCLQLKSNLPGLSVESDSSYVTPRESEYQIQPYMTEQHIIGLLMLLSERQKAIEVFTKLGWLNAAALLSFPDADATSAEEPTMAMLTSSSSSSKITSADALPQSPGSTTTEQSSVDDATASLLLLSKKSTQVSLASSNERKQSEASTLNSFGLLASSKKSRGEKRKASDQLLSGSSKEHKQSEASTPHSSNVSGHDDPIDIVSPDTTPTPPIPPVTHTEENDFEEIEIESGTVTHNKRGIK